MSTEIETGELRDMLRDSLARYAGERYAFEQRKVVLQEDCGWSRQAWEDAAEQGWLALRHPADFEGADAGCVTTAAVLELVGRHLLMEPWLQSAALAAALLRQAGDAALQAEHFDDLAQGRRTLVTAWRHAEVDCDDAGLLRGSCRGILNGDSADALILPATSATKDVTLWLVRLDQDAVHRRRHRLIDGRGMSDVYFDGAPARLLCGEAGRSVALWEWLQREALALLCAEAVGVLSRLFELTLDYVKVRKQFGRPIGSNQALQHRLVEMRLLLEESSAMAGAAAEAIDDGREEARRVVAGAAVGIFDALRQVADEATQMHGGIGITEEAEVSHYYRRASVLRGLLGPRAMRLSEFCDEGERDA